MQSATARGQLILFGKRPETMALALSEMQNGRNTTVRSACGGNVMRGKIQFAVASLLFFSAAGGMSAPARAGLVGVGTNTVSATSFIGAPLPAPVPPYPNTIDYKNSMGMITDTPPPTIPVTFLEDAISETTIAVGDTQITITNNAPTGTPFCPGAAPCNNTFAGFGFTFSSGVDITGVSVDPASAADFRPNTTSPHMGLQLLSPTDILVDVTGDAPATNDKLILDVSTSVTPTIPEPSTWALMLLGFAGLGFAGYRRKFGQAKATRVG